MWKRLALNISFNGELKVFIPSIKIPIFSSNLTGTKEMDRPPRIKEQFSKVLNWQGHSINVDNVVVLYSFSSICENGRWGTRKWKKWKLRHSKQTGILRCYHENYYNSYILDYLVKKNVVGGYENCQLFLFLSALLENYLFFLYFYLVFSSCTGRTFVPVVVFVRVVVVFCI